MNNLNLLKSLFKVQLLLAIILPFSSVLAQEEPAADSFQALDFERKGKIRLSLGIDHEHLSKDFENKQHQMWVPAYALDLNYWISDVLAVGVNTDIVLETSGLNEEHKNEYPVSLIPVVYYEPIKKFSLLAGYGWEIEKEKNINLVRAGAEFEEIIYKRYSVGVSFLYDFKNKHSNSYTFGFFLGRYL